MKIETLDNRELRLVNGGEVAVTPEEAYSAGETAGATVGQAIKGALVIIALISLL